ncbi:MAG TPA: DNA-directed RNA polymerase subunit alpha [Candidatus Saccharimonadales bacterium]|nr:DNA-directed RNA polymerase subunit alpha [Candidatus Saccharimonadales bacterium]
MNNKLIHTPALSKVTDHNPTSATFVIEPLHPGYGMTLGNSLRRVLLSSIAGAAVTGFRVNGVSHEFTTVKGIKEDVVAIMLNIKGIRFKVYSDEPQTLTISKKGKGVVRAKDIQVNASVEIVNPDHIIANVDDDKVSLNMELVIETGRGYHALDEQGSNRKISDMIMLDALFTPVLRVRYKVENTRVGQMTDLDRLLITVDTDGSITPRDAFEEAAAILVNQYTALAGQTTVESGSPLGEENEASEEGEEPAELMTSIEDLNLSARTTNALVNNDIHTIRDLLSLSEAELRDLKGFGSKALDEVKEKMAELEL